MPRIVAFEGPMRRTPPRNAAIGSTVAASAIAPTSRSVGAPGASSELVAAPPALRPTYLSADLSGLGTPHPPVDLDEGGGARCGGWQASVDGGTLAVTGDGSPEDWWRAAAVAAWRHLYTAGTPCSAEGVTPPSTVCP